MAAASTDLLQKVGLPGSATTLSAPGYTIGDTSITVPTTTNWPSDTGTTFAIDTVRTVNGREERVPGTYCEFVGVVTSPTSIGSVVKVFGDPQNYDAGSTTRVYIPVSSERENRIVTWGLTHADQDGTLKAGAVDNAAVLASGVVTNAKLATDISPAKFANPYKFSAYLSSNQIISNAADTVIAFDTELFDTGNNFDAVTNKGRFTAPVAGFYLFNLGINFAAPASSIITTIWKNGTLSHRLSQIDVTYGGAASILFQMAATDYVEFKCYQNSGTIKSMSGGTNPILTWVTGHLVSAT